MAFDQNAYMKQYAKDHYYRPCVAIPKSYKQILRDAANEHASGSVSAFIQQAVNSQLKSLGYILPEDENEI